MSALTGLEQDKLARVVAADIPPGSFVPLGTGEFYRPGSPNYLVADSGVMLHTENGMLGNLARGAGRGDRSGPGQRGQAAGT